MGAITRYLCGTGPQVVTLAQQSRWLCTAQQPLPRSIVVGYCDVHLSSKGKQQSLGVLRVRCDRLVGHPACLACHHCDLRTDMEEVRIAASTQAGREHSNAVMLNGLLCMKLSQNMCLQENKTWWLNVHIGNCLEAYKN